MILQDKEVLSKEENQLSGISGSLDPSGEVQDYLIEETGVVCSNQIHS